MKQRIDYIDLMKGICIFLIILLHVEISYPSERIDMMTRAFRIPLYFFLSGLFYKEYSCFLDFLVRKINKLVIPFLFFPWLLAFVILFDPKMDVGPTYFAFIYVQPCNFPLWFLRSLFFVYMLFYIYNKVTVNVKSIIKMLLLYIISFIVWYITPLFKDYMSSDGVKLIYMSNIIPSIIALPFFYTAYLLKQHNFLTRSYKKVYVFIFILLCLLISYLTAPNGINYALNSFGDNYLCLYICAFAGIGVVWGGAYLLKKLFYFSYIGRFSIIVLGTHLVLITLLIDIFNH